MPVDCCAKKKMELQPLAFLAPLRVCMKKANRITERTSVRRNGSLMNILPPVTKRKTSFLLQLSI
jgi:hypothetical protein